ncbi:MAG: T9SS type A sorting domain-containing protein [Bacteroidales bacterium]|nr:T9SS type A sorting domain-containing protein [Bacteroidales bacterium]
MHKGPYFIDGTAPSNPTNVTSSSHTINIWSADNTISISWSGASDGSGSGVAGYSWSWDNSSSTIPGASVTGTGTSATSPALADGNNWYFHIRTKDIAGNWNSAAVHIGPFYIDSNAPSNPTNITSSSHQTSTWSNDPTIDISWSGASDGNGSGIAGYSWIWDNTSTTIPGTTVMGTGNSTTSPTLPNANNWYFHIRTKDNVGNWNSSATHKGPFYIDVTNPSGTISINSGSTTTCLTNVTLTLNATDNLSGVSKMQFCNDGVSWSAWETYTTSKSWNLSTNGGNSSPGNKTVYAKFRDAAGNTSSTATDNIQLLESLPVSVSISVSNNPVCAGATVTFYSTYANGGNTPGFQWKKNNTSIAGATNSTYSYIPSNNDAITCVLTSSELCTTGSPVTSNSITMTVNAQMPVGVSISPSSNPVCSGSTVVFTATPSNGGSSPGYQWKKGGTDIPGATNSTYSYIPLNNDVITCQMTSNLTCATGSPALSNAIAMTVNQPAAVSVSIGASANNVCQGTSVTFTATPVNGGSSPGYQWKKNNVNISGATNSIYTYAPANGDAITCELTSNATCISNTMATSNTVVMTVNPSAPVSISISPSSNPVCSGTSVTFTATPVNGGASPGYQWKKNNVNISGATNQTYSYIPTNGEVITCVLNSNANCATGSPATSNAITMVVNSALTAGITISASSNPACAGSVVTFTATPSNGGSSPGYQWKKGGIDIPGATNSTYSYIPLNNDAITCEMTSNLTCATGSPALSNAITMTVNQPAAVSVSIGASANNVCQGTSVTFTATPVNSGSSPGYQWKKNNVNISGATNSIYTYAPANGDAITCELTSNATCISNTTATSNTVVMTVIPSAPVGIIIVASSNPVCIGAQVTFTATPTNGGSSPGYQWKKNNVNISGATNQTYSYVPANGEVITCVLNSNANCATGSPATSNAVTMVVNSALTAGISISASSNPACAGTVVTFTATPSNGGSSPGYQWKKGGVNIAGATNSTYSCIPLNNEVFTCQMTSNLTCATGNPANSNAITMSINQPVPVSVTIDASANGICQGTSVSFTATPVNGGSSPGYQWKKNSVNISGATNSTYIYAPANGDAITCELTSNATCISNTTATSNTINIAAMPPAPVSISITASANPVCSGTAVTFTAAFVNGGIFPGFQWKKNGTAISGATNSTYTYTPANNDIITCVLTSNVVCPVGNPATSNAINMSVTTSIPAGVSILASTNNVCAGTTVHFTAYPVNGGTSPGYQWKKNGVPVGTNQPTYSCVPQNFDVITCTLTSNLSCASGNPVTSNAVIMNITTPAVVGVLIYASSNPSCSGAPVTYTATASNQGTTPVYRWMKNGITVGSNSSAYSYIPSAGDLITCELTSNATCIQNPTAISNVITTALIPSVPVSVSIIASANPVCSGTPVTFTASSVNGGNTPVYQWKKNGTEIGPNSPVFTYAPGNGDVITCTLISSVNCPTGSPATSNAITMGVNTSLAAGISVVPSTNPACQGSTVTFTAAPVNGGTTPVYQWKVNGINVGVNTPAYSFVPQNNDQVWCEMTSNLGCATGNPALSNTVTMVMQQIYPVALSVSASANPVCVGSQVIFTAHPVNGGAAPAYQWKRNGIITGTNDPVLSLVPDNNDLITCQLTSSELCTTGNPAVSNQVIMTVNPNLQPGVTVTASENPVCNGTPVSFSATPVNGGSSPGYQWRVNNTLVGTNNPSYTYIPSDNDYIVCDLVSNASCITGNPATSNVIRMSVDNQLFVGVSITVASSTVCIGSPAYFTAHPVNGGLSPVYQWRINGINAVSAGPTFSYIPVQGDVVTCEMTSGISCAMNNPVFSNPIEMTTVQPVPVSVSITTPLSTVCQGRPITYTAYHINGGPAPSYQWKVNGINAGTNNQFFTYIPSNGDVVSCILTTSLTCVTNTTATSNVIQMTVDPLQPVSLAITPSANPVLPGTAVTFTATWTNGGSSPVFQWKVNGISVGSNSPVYTYVPNNLDEVVCEMTSDIICVTVNPVISNPVNMVVTFLPVGITISATANNICAGSYIEFTATPVNGGTDPQYQWKVNGIDVGTNSPAYGYTPVDQDVVTCVLTSNAPNVTGNPATSNPVIMIVKSNLPVSVIISPDVNPVCPQSQVTLTAVPVNGGTTPFYQWKVNGINSGVNNPVFTYFPSNGDIVVCRLTSSEECTDENPVMSNGITMQVPSVIPVSLTIGASANPVNSGIPVTFTANPVNPGNAPFFQWKVNGVDKQNNTPVFSYIPVNGDQVVCLMTSGHSCASVNPAVSNTIIMTVNIVPAITVLTPDGGEYWIQGSVQNITWTDNISENVKIELLKGETYYETLVSSTPSTGSWSWTIPADQQVGIDYRIRITSVSDNAITDNSDASFKIMANVVSNLVVQNMEISNGMNSCFDALNTITVAGNGSFFHVTGGSYVTFIAGVNILFMPGTQIYNGGMMHGYIAPTGPFCGTMAPSFINVTAGNEDPVEPMTNQRILIYPNPTTGIVTLEFVPEDIHSGARIYIYSMNGSEVLQKDLPQMKKETFMLDFLTPGIYLCRIVYNGKQELVKIVML